MIPSENCGIPSIPMMKTIRTIGWMEIDLVPLQTVNELQECRFRMWRARSILPQREATE
jgi:hypothetical protein